MAEALIRGLLNAGEIQVQRLVGIAQPVAIDVNQESGRRGVFMDQRKRRAVCLAGCRRLAQRLHKGRFPASQFAREPHNRSGWEFRPQSSRGALQFV